jgi:hypothetical protein
MWLASFRHTKMVGELALFRVAMSSGVESVLKLSPGNIAHAVVVGELVTEFQKVEDHCSWLEQPATMICDLLLGPQPNRAWLADHLNVAIG